MSAPEPIDQVVQMIRCPACIGAGVRRRDLVDAEDRLIRTYTACPACHGSGTAAERVVSPGPEPFSLAKD
jgi:hypothetical protein